MLIDQNIQNIGTEGNPVFVYHDAFNRDRAEVEELKARYREGRVGDVEVKTKLAQALNAMLEPMRERRAEVLARPGHVDEILFEGSRRARAEAAETMARVREAMKIAYRPVGSGVSRRQTDPA